MKNPFNSLAENYDKWYEKTPGRQIFMAETACLKSIGGNFTGRWLEVGVGTGRFAEELGIYEGVDPSEEMLAIASRKGIKTFKGKAELLPYEENSFDGILMSLTLCFVNDVVSSIKETFRVLKPGGIFIAGIVPAESTWGEAYLRKKKNGHKIYRYAEMQSPDDIVCIADETGFSFMRAASTLFWDYGKEAEESPKIVDGINNKAGFVGLVFEKTECR